MTITESTRQKLIDSHKGKTMPQEQKDKQNEADKFLKEYREYSRFDRVLPKISSEDDINEYRKSFLDFRMFVDQSSHTLDPVDAMNLENISKLNSSGMKISDLYDRVAATNYKTSNIDIVGMQHNENRNNRIVSNQFTYENDTVNNGGFFFDKITASDVDNETHMPFERL